MGVVCFPQTSNKSIMHVAAFIITCKSSCTKWINNVKTAFKIIKFLQLQIAISEITIAITHHYNMLRF